MSGEVVRNAVIDKEKAPESIADFDRAEIRRGEGLVLISGEQERKVGLVGEFAMDLLVELGLAKEETTPSDEISPAAQEVIDRLQSQVTALEAENAALQEQFAKDLKALEGRVEALTEKLENLRPLDERLKEDFDDKWVPRDGDPIEVAEIDGEGYISKGWTASGDPYKKEDGSWYIQVTNSEVTEEKPLDEIFRPKAEPAPEESPGSLGWRERIANWTSLRRPVTYIQTRRAVGGGKVEEVEVTEDRPNPLLYIGGLALAGFIGWELAKHSGHDHSKEIHNLFIQNHDQSTKINHLTKTVNHDSTIIKQNHDLLKQDTRVIHENHRILKHNRAVLKHLHEQVHHLFKIERAEHARELSENTAASGGEARLGYYGDTVWHETARRMRGASVEKIRKATNYVLRLNGLRWNGGGSGVDAHKLPLGFRFRIPKNIVQIANR